MIYHVGMYYVSWPWHLKSAFASPALEPWMRLRSPWRMSLLFLVAGAATAFMQRKHGAGAILLRERAKRLLLPLVAGVLVIVPPQSYLQVVQQAGYGGDYLDFMRLYLMGDGGFRDALGHRLVLPTWNHLWFLPYLFVYTAFGALALRWWPAALDRMAARAGAVLSGAGLIVWPVIVLALVRWWMAPRFPVTHALIDDPFSHAQYLPMFVLGAALARHGGIWARMQAVRWLALGLALVAWALLLGADNGAPSGLRPLGHAIRQWCALVAAIGFAHRHLNRDNVARRWLTEAVFPIYALHQTLILLGAAWLAGWALRPALEGPILLAFTVLGAGLGYAIVRQVPLLRPWLGLAPVPPKARAPAPRRRGLCSTGTSGTTGTTGTTSTTSATGTTG